MFPARSHLEFTRPGQPPRRPGSSGTGGELRVGALGRLGLLFALLMGTVPGGVSAQAFGTMQVTARVLLGRPGWAALSEAHNLTRSVLSAPLEGARTRRAGLVQTRAELAPAGGRRRLLVTIQYPHN